MFEKKLNQKDLEELKKRTELINQYTMIAEALEIQKRIYLRNILPKYGLDMNQEYQIDFKDGKIKKLRKQKQKDE